MAASSAITTVSKQTDDGRAVDLERYHAQMEAELATARIMQLETLPKAEQLQILQKNFGINITAWFEPSDQISGDIWGVWNLSPTKMAVYLLDFSTHGVTAALNTLSFNMMVRRRDKLMFDPAEYLKFLNNQLCPVLLPEQFATALYGIIDIESHTFTYAAGASTQPLVLSLGAQEIIVGERSGLPLGISSNASYVNRSLSFSPGMALFLYSDAMSEGRREDETLIGDAGVIGLVKSASVNAGEEFDASKVLEMFFEIAVRPLKDDLTVVCLVRPTDGHPTDGAAS